MKNTTTAAIFFLAAGILTSVTILSAYQILFAIPAVYYSFLAIKNKEFHLPKSAWWLLAFTLVALISTSMNFDILEKPSKNFGRLKYFLFGVSGIFVFRAWLKEASEKTKSILSNTFLISIVVAGAFAIFNFFTSDEGRSRGLTDTMRYGYGSAMLLLTLSSAILHRKKLPWFNYKLGIVALIVGFAAMYSTYTRGALLGFVCGLPFVIYFYRAKLGLIIGAVSLAAVITIGSIYLFGNMTGSTSRFLVSKNNPSDVIRRSQWQAAIIATKERPVLGWGLSNFSSQLKRIKYAHDLDAKDYDSHSHNLFLEVASGTGLIGLFFFLGWIATWAWEAFRSNQLVAATVVPFGVAWVVSSQFEVTLDANNASMIFLLYAVSSAISFNDTGDIKG